MNIKSYKDGDRMILVIENCTGETEKKVSRLVCGLMDLNVPDESVQEEVLAKATDQKEITDLEPVDVPEEKIPEIKPEQEVKLEAPAPEKGSKGYLIKSMDDALKLLVAEEDNAEGAATAAYWMAKSGQDYLTPLLTDNYYRKSLPLKKNVHKLLDGAGYGTAAEFLEFAGERMKKDFGETLLNAVWKRCKIRKDK